VPDLLSSKEEAEVLRTKRIRAQDMISAANHAFGTTRMAKRPEDGVVDERGRCHDTENVFIADTGIFPGSPAVNPMLTCMALSDLVATEIAAHS
jgi:choline dehydrogenase-like flavoprotein